MERPPEHLEVSKVRETQKTERMWRLILSSAVIFRGPGWVQRHLFRLIPAMQRCKNCLAPLEGPGVMLMQMLGRGPFHRNPRFCNF